MKKLTIKHTQQVYEKHGASAVYDLANKHKLKYGDCKPCEANTPTINKCCALCGQSKSN